MAHFHSPSTNNEHTYSVILADDHPVVLIGTRMALDTLVAPKIIITAEATSSDTLLQELEDRPCDVLITDLSMPAGKKPDGLTLISHIRRHFPETKIIVLTMINNESVLRHLFALGIMGAINKHQSLKELHQAVRCVLNGERYLCATFSAALDTVKRGEPQQKALSAKEYEVIRLLALGLAGRDIAKRLNRSEKTISRQKRSAMQKQGIRNDSELASMWHAPL